MSTSCRCCGHYRENVQSSRFSIQDTICAERFGFESGKVFELNNEINLEGRVCVLPKNVIIKSKGGIIKNGVLVGQNTRVLYKYPVFDSVTIKGSWIVPVIKSSMFKDLSYDNSLRDVLALTNPDIKNKVIVYQGIYIVSAENNGDACLILNSNTDFILEGTIQMSPNAYTDYDIIRVEGENIVVEGNGFVVGDKFSHLSKEGEWGMGIRVQRSQNIIIRGLTIEKCWGDCIYVGRGSNNVKIEKCVLDHGRRQGISVTKADRVSITRCKISNVKGTSPEYAIDVEPNPGEYADNIVIENVEVNNCKGGLLVYGRGESAKIGEVTISNCIISGVEKNAVCILSCDKAVLNRCKIFKQQDPLVIRCEDIESLELKDNSFSYYNDLSTTVKKVVDKITGEYPDEPIVVLRCNNVSLRNNKKK